VNPVINVAILIVEAMFVIGGIGSALVLLWVGVEDLHTMFAPGEEEE